MPKCRECDATLPDEARFCLQCGAAVEQKHEGSDSGQPPQPLPPLDFVQPALAGGLFLGLLSSLPLIALGNCACCMWVLAGGGIGTYLLTRQRPIERITFGDGAFVGVLSGFFGAIVATVISIPIKLLSANYIASQQDAIEKAMQQFGEMDETTRSLIMRLLSPEISGFTLLFTFVSNLIIYALFAMVGGILTVAILNRRAR
jgi:hypothetical protein